MRRVNKIIFLFLSLVTLSCFSLWQFVQSPFFASLLQRYMGDFVHEKLDARLTFGRIQLGLFPLQTNLVDISFKKKLPENIDIALRAQKLDANFSFFDLLLNRVTVKHLDIYDGELTVENCFNEKEKKLLEHWKNKWKEIPKLYKEKCMLPLQKAIQRLANQGSSTKKVLPFARPNIEQIGVEDIRVKIEDFDFSISSIELRPGKKQIELFFLLENIHWQGVGPNRLSSFIKISENAIRFKNFKMYHQLSLLSLDAELTKDEISGQWGPVSGNVQFTGNLSSPFWSLEMLGVIHDLQLQKGNIVIDGKLSGSLQVPKFTAQVELGNVVFRYGQFAQGKFSFEMGQQPDVLRMHAFNILDEDQEIQLLQPFDIDLGTANTTWGIDKARLQIKNYHSHRLLSFLHETLEPFHGIFNGDISLWARGKEFAIDIAPNFEILKFSLASSQPNKNILSGEKISIKKGNLEISPASSRVAFSGVIAVKNETQLSFKGKVINKDLVIKIEQSPVNLQDIGPISSVPLQGKGMVSGEFEIRPNMKKMYFSLDVQQAGVIGLHLGSVKTDLLFDLQKSFLDIQHLDGNFNKAQYHGEGRLKFDPAQIKLKVSFDGLTAQETVWMGEPIFNRVREYAQSIQGTFAGEFTLQGGLEANKMLVEGHLHADTLNIWGERWSPVEFNFRFAHNVVALNKIFLQKKDAFLQGDLSYNINTRYIAHNLIFKNLKFSYLDFLQFDEIGLYGIADGQLQGEGTPQTYNGSSKIELKDMILRGINLAPTEINLLMSEQVGKVKILSKDEKFKMDLSLNMREGVKSFEKLSHLQIYLQNEQIATLLGFISPQSVQDRNLKGGLTGEIKAHFNYHRWSHLDLVLRIEDFYIIRKKVALSISRSKRTISIRDGHILNWDLGILGDGGSFNSWAEGNLNNNFRLKVLGSFDSSLLELLHPNIVSSSGTIEAKYILEGNLEKLATYFYSTSQDLDMQISKDMPGIEDLEYKLTYHSGRLLLENFLGKYGSGKIQGDGEIFFTFPYPQLNIIYTLQNAHIPFLKKSSALVSGKGMLSGKSPPYSLSGDFSILKASILEELEDFAEKKSEKTDTYERFLPKIVAGERRPWVNLNLNVDTVGDISVRNNMMAMNLKGPLKILGRPDHPHFDGELNLIPGSGRIYFKTYDFELTKGNIHFLAAEKDINPEINFNGFTKIFEYKINLNAYGRAKSMTLDLSSDPVLAQEDILSLLTLGYTTETSKALSPEERQSLASIGIGSILFNRFKINEQLKSSFGLKLSLVPEFSEGESNFVSNKNGDTSPSGSKIRTATKVKLQKKLTDSVNLSLSSTVGGSLGQKQEMNLNYNFNNNMAVEGSYEVKTGNEDKQVQNALGADLIFKWTFK